MNYKLRRFIRKYSCLHLPLTRIKWEKWMKVNHQKEAPTMVVTSESEFVLDGFPRSGNTFFHAIFKVTQRDDLKIAHHAHSIAQIAYGVKRKLPTVVIMRNPREAVLAYVAFDPQVPLEESILDWISFYGNLLKLEDDYVIADFDEFIKDANQTIRRLNAKFGGQFLEFSHEERLADAKQFLADRSGRLFGKPHGSLPSESRSAFKDRLRPQLESEPCASLMTKADAIYRKALSIK